MKEKLSDRKFQLERVKLSDRKSLFLEKKNYTDENLRADIRTHRDRLVDAVEKYGATSMSSRNIDKIVVQVASRRFASSDPLRYMQPFARAAWQGRLLKAFEAAGQLEDLRMITIIDRDWRFSEKTWAFDRDKITRDVRNRCRGMNFVVMIEFAYFRNVQCHGGRLIAPHIQGISWGKMTRKEMTGISNRFKGGLFGTKPIYRRRVYDLPGAISYSVKPPYHGYSVIPRANGRYGHCRSPLSLKQHFLLWQNLSDFTYPDLTFASGQGTAVLRRARSFSK